MMTNIDITELLEKYAQNLEKKAENSSNLPQNVVVNDISNSINNYTVEELLEMLKTQKKP